MDARANDSPIDWVAFCDEHLPHVFNYFRYRFTDEKLAQDLTSATFERAWQGRRQFRGSHAQATAWIYTIARNQARDQMRKRTFVSSLDALPGIAASERVEDTVQHRQDLARLRQLLYQLADRERELIALKYGAGRTNREIAAVTGLSESNVGTILHRVVLQLRQNWEHQHE